MSMQESINSKAQGLAVFSQAEFTIDRQLKEQPGRAHSYHYHDAYEMYYLFSGDKYYFIKDKTYHAKRGSLVMIKPYEIHHTSNFSNEPYERMLITFKKHFLDELSGAFQKTEFFKCFDENIHIIEFSGSEQAFVESALYSMLREAKNEGYESECLIKMTLAQLLLLTVKHSGNENAQQEGYRDAVHKTVSLAAAYINNNYREDITLDSLAERFFISPCYLSRTFKRVTGSSFVEYVNGVRIKEAQRLLLKSDMRVSKIAYTVGFKSTTHFGRAFKSVVGKSPLSYRKLQ